MELSQTKDARGVRACTVFWFTGLSGAGKTTIALALKERLENEGRMVELLDGDVVRNTLHKHLGFTPEDIRENNRLIAELAKKRMEECDIILVPIISPFKDARALARKIIGDNFVELYVEASENTRVSRDPKGLYKKVHEGNIVNLIGYRGGIAYEVPEDYDIKITTETETLAESVDRVVRFIT